MRVLKISWFDTLEAPFLTLSTKYLALKCIYEAQQRVLRCHWYSHFERQTKLSFKEMRLFWSSFTLQRTLKKFYQVAITLGHHSTGHCITWQHSLQVLIEFFRAYPRFSFIVPNRYKLARLNLCVCQKSGIYSHSLSTNSSFCNVVICILLYFI